MGAEFAIDAAERTPPIPRLCRYLTEWSPLPMVAVEGATHVGVAVGAGRVADVGVGVDPAAEVVAG